MKKQTTSYKAKKRTVNILVHVLLAVLAIIWVFPIAWVVMISFRAEKGSYTSSFLPKSFTLDNYKKLFTDTTILNFPRMFMNTLIIAIFVCIISTIFVLAVSYCMSRLRFKMRKKYLNIAMILGLFPGFMSMIAVYYILKAIGLSEGSMTRVALIMVYSAGSGLGFYIAKGFFDTIPKALDEAAFLDGATKFQVFTKVTIPLSKPIIVYTVYRQLVYLFCSRCSLHLDPDCNIVYLYAEVLCRRTDRCSKGLNCDRRHSIRSAPFLDILQQNKGDL